jgi:ATP synthase protein I
MAWNPRAFDDEETDGDADRAPLTRDEARALLARSRAVSPWYVLAVQAVVGLCVALLAVLFTGRMESGWSALYGAAVVVVPGALMARGMTSRLTSLSPGLSAVSVLAWELVKISVSLLMLVLAGRIVQHLSWPAMLAAMVVCLQVYWVALRWRGSTKNLRT